MSGVSTLPRGNLPVFMESAATAEARSENTPRHHISRDGFSGRHARSLKGCGSPQRSRTEPLLPLKNFLGCSGRTRVRTILTAALIVNFLATVIFLIIDTIGIIRTKGGENFRTVDTSVLCLESCRERSGCDDCIDCRATPNSVQAAEHPGEQTVKTMKRRDCPLQIAKCWGFSTKNPDECEAHLAILDDPGGDSMRAGPWGTFFNVLPAARESDGLVRGVGEIARGGAMASV